MQQMYLMHHLIHLFKKPTNKNDNGVGEGKHQKTIHATNDTFAINAAL